MTSVFGPVHVTRLAYRNRREPNLYPADARQVLPDDPCFLGMRALAAFHLVAGGFGQAQEVIEARTGVTVGRAQLTGLAEDLAAWTGGFYEERSRDAEEEEQPDSDVIMMQADGKGIAMRPDTAEAPGRRTARARDQEDGRDRRRRRLHPRRPGTGGHRRPARPPPGAPRPGRRDKWVAPRSPSPSRT